MLGLLILKMSTGVSDPALVNFAVESLVNNDSKNISPQIDMRSICGVGSVFDGVGSGGLDSESKQFDDDVDLPSDILKSPDKAISYSNLLPKICISVLIDEEFSHVRSVGADENSFHRALVFEWCRHVIEDRGLDENDRQIIFSYVILSDAQFAELEDSTIAVREMLLWANILRECVVSASMRALRSIFSAPSTDLFAVWVGRQRCCMILRDHLQTPGLVCGQKQMTLQTFLELKGENVADVMMDVVSLRKRPSHAALICASFAFLATIDVFSATSQAVIGQSEEDFSAKTRNARENVDKVSYVGAQDLYDARIQARNKAGVPSPTKLPSQNEVRKALSKMQPFKLNLFSECNGSVFRVLYKAGILPASTAVTEYVESGVEDCDIGVDSNLHETDSELLDGHNFNHGSGVQANASTEFLGAPRNEITSKNMIAPYDYEPSKFEDHATDSDTSEFSEYDIVPDGTLTGEVTHQNASSLSYCNSSASNTEYTGGSSNLRSVVADLNSKQVPQELNEDLLFGTTFAAGYDSSLQMFEAKPDDTFSPNQQNFLLKKKKTPRIPSLDFLKKPRIPEIPSSSSSFVENSALLGPSIVNNSFLPTESCDIKNASEAFVMTAETSTDPDALKELTADAVIEVPEYVGTTTDSDLLISSKIGSRREPQIAAFVITLLILITLAVSVARITSMGDLLESSCPHSMGVPDHHATGDPISDAGSIMTGVARDVVAEAYDRVQTQGSQDDKNNAESEICSDSSEYPLVPADPQSSGAANSDREQMDAESSDTHTNGGGSGNRNDVDDGALVTDHATLENATPLEACIQNCSWITTVMCCVVLLGNYISLYIRASNTDKKLAEFRSARYDDHYSVNVDKMCKSDRDVDLEELRDVDSIKATASSSSEEGEESIDLEWAPGSPRRLLAMVIQKQNAKAHAMSWSGASEQPKALTADRATTSRRENSPNIADAGIALIGNDNAKTPLSVLTSDARPTVLQRSTTATITLRDATNFGYGPISEDPSWVEMGRAEVFDFELSDLQVVDLQNWIQIEEPNLFQRAESQRDRDAGRMEELEGISEMVTVERYLIHMELHHCRRYYEADVCDKTHKHKAGCMIREIPTITVLTRDIEMPRGLHIHLKHCPHIQYPKRLGQAIQAQLENIKANGSVNYAISLTKFFGFWPGL